jgi:exodeoxyribonuclease-3
MQIASVNVNGIRAASQTGKSAKNGYGLKNWMQDQGKDVDVLCLQELKATQEEIGETLDFLNIDSDKFFIQSDQDKKGHAGVAIAVLNPEIKIQEIKTPFENQTYTSDILCSGRYIEVDLETKSKQNLTIASAYIHHADSPTSTRRATKAEIEKGSKREVTIDRKQSEFTMNNKHLFMDKLTEYLRQQINLNKEFVICGDYNIAHKNIDLKAWENNKTKAGFLPEERVWLDLWFAKKYSQIPKEIINTFKENKDINYKTPKEAITQFNLGGLGLHDVCRELWGETGEQSNTYTWWTYMGHAFDNNAGWRIDYQSATEKLSKTAKWARVDKPSAYNQRYTDHAPLVVNYDI